MSVEKYIDPNGSTAVEYYALKLRQAVEYLVRHAPVTVDTTITDTEDEYAVILNAGYGRYAKLRAAKDDTSGIVDFSVGYKDGGYMALRSDEVTYASPVVFYQPLCTSVYIANGGDIWELNFPTAHHNVIDYGRIHTIRGSKIVSSLDGAEYLALGVGQSTETGLGNDYPLIDGIMFRYEDYEPREYMLSCSDPDTAHNNVGEGKLMLFPSLLCAPGPFQTGAAMIGNQSTFFMSCRPTDPIPRYEEFVLNRQKFVSLGRLAIRSR